MRTVPVLLSLLCLSACAAPSKTLETPWRVLLLGDSISIGYHAAVCESLQEFAHVVRPTLSDDKKAENCAGTTKGVGAIDRWLALDGGAWDLIHFNFGLHDIKRVDPKTRKNSNNSEDPHQADPEIYEKQLRFIAEKLQRTGARLIFSTTTPVPEGKVVPLRVPEEVETYNAIARSVMENLGIQVHDLYAFALPRLAEIQKPVNVHFTPEGSRLLGIQVAAAIRAAAVCEDPN